MTDGLSVRTTQNGYDIRTFGDEWGDRKNLETPVDSGHFALAWLGKDGNLEFSTSVLRRKVQAKNASPISITSCSSTLVLVCCSVHRLVDKSKLHISVTVRQAMAMLCLPSHISNYISSSVDVHMKR